MKNIRFYEAEKYNTDEYVKVEDMIYKTIFKSNCEYLHYQKCLDTDLVTKLLDSEEWVQGTSTLLKNHLILIYDGKKYYRRLENIGTNDDIVFIEIPEKKETIYVTSIVYEPEPEFGENEPDDKKVSQYPLEDILDEFFVFCNDLYHKENENDEKNSYIEFASQDIDDIRNLLSIIGKHVYDQEDGEYVELIIE